MVGRKVCRVCNIEKDYEEFFKLKSHSTGRASRCKKCEREYKIKQNRTKNGLAGLLYYEQKCSSKARGHNLPTYSISEFKKWLFSQPNFQALYNRWCENNYESQYRPSADRLDDSKGYSFDNIQLISWYDNREKLLVKTRKRIQQLDKDGKIISTYKSGGEAGRAIKGESKYGALILHAAHNNSSAYGFRWKFVE